MPSPPQSPPLAARHAPVAKPSSNRGSRARRGGAAQTITGECERLFCETLRTVFLGEGNLARQDSLVTGVHNYNQYSTSDISDYGVDVRRYTERPSGAVPSPEMEGGMVSEEQDNGLVSDWVEIWDYVGGNRFRGFVAEKDGEKTLFVFFDQLVIGGDLKAALMALLELCDVPYFSCSRLVACIDRHAEAHATEALSKDLGWIGFQLTTLDDFTSGDEITSNKWLLMDMEV
ncbi:hypothetical protein BU24DRAFT_375185 [Aaosphaeria arxii CBS 175.79]|uniref:Ornithine decarboxylase antizyme n=1 Tax=Aaosphaeria arxii CBS 175.79 TaxID=1450172 RepID=A0A6A5XG45_9PLEO|nr:uncharacterized protein BU24DRAFT_375185 [Aaosphaeria arxii CBS 175.79]KAF2011900.1 hypothetical protein BU24DRAFT_375185 [Aaosphaeria arxii CBS 175.79]